MPVLARQPVIVTLHDATFFSDPGVHSRLKGLFFRAWTRYSLGHAAFCIAPSQATVDELSRFAAVRSGRVTVIPHGVDLDLFAPPTATERAAAATIVGAEEWITFLGTLEPRKNAGALVEAFAEIAVANPTLRLALVGAPGWDTSLAATIEASGCADRIRQLGYVPLDTLPGLLGGAAVVCYPSLGEGFGLPVLEAMATGAAVLTTRRLALPEVGGDAVAYSEPDAHSLAVSLGDLLAHGDRRRDLGARARQRALGFSWDVSARRHVDLMLSASAGSAL